MAAWRQQALVEAPVEDVWALISDWNHYADWNDDVIKVTGGPAEFERGSMFELRGRGPLGLKATTPFKVEKFEDMREMKVKCQVSGFYAHWLLTEARGNTFTEVELGVEPKKGLQARATGTLHTKGYLRRSVEQMIDNLRGALARDRSSAT
ncbi:MAG: SRPBCC family protein [Solirubrobacterales bacterium]